MNGFVVRRFFVLAALALTPHAAHAQTPQSAEAEAPAQTEMLHLEDSELEARTREVASQLRCPVCQGLSVQDSPTEFAQDMKALIRDQLAEGRSAEEVKEYFIGRYGEWVLLEPKPQGFNLAVYVLPVFGLALGIGIVMRAVRRWVKVGGTEDDPDPLPR